jgi:DNA-directed RNA polymerase alpha subunit
MTNREIKFELVKIALVNCASIDSIKQMYDWIIEEPEVDVDKPKTDYDNTSVREIIKHLVKNGKYSDQRYASSLVNVFNDNGINTIGDILRIGRREFMQIKGVGKGSITRIDDALEDLYGIVNWSSNETF